MDQDIATLAGLTAAQVTPVTCRGITTSDDIMILENDVVLLLPRASVLVRRKLSNVAVYLAAGNELDSTTTIWDVMTSLSRLNRRTGTTMTSMTDTAARRAPKLYVDGLENFDGTPIKWKTGKCTHLLLWDKQSTMALSQTHLLQQT
jgi:hypothetical protein